MKNRIEELFGENDPRLQMPPSDREVVREMVRGVSWYHWVLLALAIASVGIIWYRLVEDNDQRLMKTYGGQKAPKVSFEQHRY